MSPRQAVARALRPWPHGSALREPTTDAVYEDRLRVVGENLLDGRMGRPVRPLNRPDAPEATSGGDDR
jgi:hypothetical protein